MAAPSFSGLLLSFHGKEQKTPCVLSPAEKGGKKGEWAAESNQWWEKCCWIASKPQLTGQFHCRTKNIY